jgi:hypothetical protein
LLFVAIGFGVPNLNAQTKAIKVANNQQLIEAMGNPSIGTVVLDPGYYEYLDFYATSETKLTKSVGDGNNRDIECQYYIYDANVCLSGSDVFIDPVADPPIIPAIPPGSYYIGNAIAGTNDPLTCGCCPAANGGTWQWIKTASSYVHGVDTLVFAETIDQEDMIFYVTGPGIYALRYSWGAPWNSYVQTEYVFRGPTEVLLSAPDVCGLSTEVDFTLTGLTGLGYDVVWKLENTLTDVIYTLTGPDVPDTTGVYTFTLDLEDYDAECGYYKLTALVYTTYDPESETDCADTTSIYIDFACEPIADAGPDVNVCDELCYYSLHGSYGGVLLSTDHAWSWVELSHPPANPPDADLIFGDPTGLITSVCREDLPLPGCSYGEYAVEFQVQNGECYDSDTMMIRFYEQPVANAGPDQHLCNTFSFTLAAVPYDYCGDEGVNYWADHYWSFVSFIAPAVDILPPGGPDGNVSIVDPNDPGTLVNITGGTCPYGEYTFVWTEINSKGVDLGGCEAEDYVTVFIYEDPDIDAGPDMVFCNTFAFTLFAEVDEPCYENTVVVYSWEKSEEPGHCGVEFTPADEPGTDVVLLDCEPCQYGKYIFTFTQSNGYLDEDENFVSVCSTSDDVIVWNFEEPIANAGPDQHICNSFAFTLTADLTEFCGVPIVREEGNYNTWGEWVFVSGPTDEVTIVPVNDSVATVTVDDGAVDCPYGVYIFQWVEYNGFGTPGLDFEGCFDDDFVSIFIDETPESINAGPDQSLCNTFEFDLDGTVDDPCTDGTAYSIHWELYSQPEDCDVVITTPFDIDPGVSITNCGPCPFGEYVFILTQQNGYYDGENREFVEVCSNTDTVSVWIWQPVEVDAGDDQNLCNDFAFSLTGVGTTYCGYHNNRFEWALISYPTPANCQVAIADAGSLIASVVIGPCQDGCMFGEYKFKFTEYNGNLGGWCEDSDTVSVFIFEDPIADAGEDVAECVDIATSMYCYDMTGTMDYCYSMYGVWTKTCGPGGIIFTDENDPETEVCFNQPGRYKFTWTLSNAACEDEDEVIFDLIEQPTASAEDDELIALCDSLCIDLGDAGINKYEYYGVEFGGNADECPNYWDNAYWSFVDGPGGVTFADDTDPETEMCVTVFGCYTVRWNEVNRSVDGELECSAYVDIFVQFVETPVPDAGDAASLCGNCYTMEALPYLPSNCTEAESDSYWEFYNYVPPVDPCLTDEFSIDYTADYEISNPNDPNARICIADDCLGSHYGTYVFIWVNESGFCIGYDTVNIEFKKIPEKLALEGLFDPSNCSGGSDNPWDCDGCAIDCLYPEERVIEVCAGSCLDWSIDWDCFCNGMPIPGYTYEWSFIGPSGSFITAEPYWYDCYGCDGEGCWRGDDHIHICFGECCDTARLYLTITTPQGCETTEEWKFFVNHKPCVNIEGPEISEVNAVATYCNVCSPDMDSCLLYNWTAEHCGIINEGQGTECIDVLWTDYNINGGIGEITLTVYDTCTGCCNYDEMAVKIYPTGTVGADTLSGQVFYDHRDKTTPNAEVDIPLNDVHITLWNGDVATFETDSYVKFVEIDDTTAYSIIGYYEFPNINGETPFGLTATYDKPWIPANATDALAVQLKVIDMFPQPFFPLVGEAMDVNISNTISATDALWIKQRAIGMVTYFPAGDWVFTPDMDSIVPNDGPYDIYALNAGDANRDNYPSSTKAAPAIDLVTDGTMNVETGKVFELPIRVADASQFGAITLDLSYNPALIEVVEVVPADGMISNITVGNVSIAYSSVNPMIMLANDVVVTLKVKAISPFTSAEALFTIGMNSEFADGAAKVVEPVTLKSFGVTTGPAAADYFLSANRPNPFSTSTFIEYTMPESGKVKLSVLDMLGQEIAVLVDATQGAGSYTVEFSAAGLATGVYIYKITVDGETRDFISTERMVISH